MNSGLQAELIIGSVVYTLLGLVLMVGSVMLVNHVFKLDLKKEILEEHNVASAIVISGIFLSIAIIVGSAIFG